MIDDIPTIIESIRANYAKGCILQDDLTLKPCYIAKVGDYFAHGETLKQAFNDANAKYTQNLSEDERISMFLEHFATYKKYPAKEYFVWHNTLTGSCEYGRKSFCEQRGINVDTDEFTVSEFIELTKNSYGSEIIKKLNN